MIQSGERTESKTKINQHPRKISSILTEFHLLNYSLCAEKKHSEFYILFGAVQMKAFETKTKKNSNNQQEMCINIENVGIYPIGIHITYDISQANFT